MKLLSTALELAKKPSVAYTIAALGTAVGAYAGHRLSLHILQSAYQQLLEAEVASTREYYKKLNEQKTMTDSHAAETLVKVLVPEKVSLDKAVERVPREAARAMTQYRGIAPVPTENDANFVPARSALFSDTGDLPTLNEVTRSVFDKDETDLAERIALEVRDRSEDFPYIISKEEFFENVPEHEQDTLTYYEGDGVLAETDDSVVLADDIDWMIGNYNLPRFGHRSDDPNVLYVRNHVKGMDFEIVRHTGKYAVVVAGETPED